jgi:hypothetical protein
MLLDFLLGRELRRGPRRYRSSIDRLDHRALSLLLFAHKLLLYTVPKYWKNKRLQRLAGA